MTISLTNNSGQNVIGIGASLQIASSFGPGSTPPGTNWWISCINLESTSGAGWRYVVPAPTFGPTSIIFGSTDFGGLNIVFDTSGLSDAQPIKVDLSLVSPTAHIDDTTLSSPFKWQGDASTQKLILQQPSGGLTDAQALQLSNAEAAAESAYAGIQTTITQGGSTIATTIGQLFGGFGLDSLAVEDLSGGVVCTPVDVTLAGFPFGVIVEATTIPDFYPFTAPGDQWTPLDLAVIQFVRGTDVLKRIGMHTRKHMEYPLPGVILPLGTLIELPLLPPDYHLEVWWGNGVCGQVFGMRAP